MSRVIRRTEDAPAARPELLGGATDEAIYQRFEAWCKTRWGARSVQWVVIASGADEFVPDLRPATFTGAELWMPAGWTAQDIEDGPIGKCLRSGTWRLTYTVGDDTVAADVKTAAQRYADYVTQTAGEAGIVSLRDGDYSVQRDPTALARALTYSGAADLLRAYR